MKTIFNFIFLFLGSMLMAQHPYTSVSRGNNDFHKQRYEEAEIEYRKAIEKDASQVIPQFNLGNAQYQQGRFEEAHVQYELSANNFATPTEKAEAFHNIGNTFLSQQKYEESIKAYKEALKLVPSDMDTKYNLAYAQLMLKKEQEQNQNQPQDQNKDQNQDDQQDQDKKDQQDQGEDSKDNKDQKKDPKDGDQNKDDQQGNKDKKDEEKSGDEDKQEKAAPKEVKLTKEQADQLLKALENEEAKLQEKLDKPEGEPVMIIIENDW